jgi:hypothetical protein
MTAREIGPKTRSFGPIPAATAANCEKFALRLACAFRRDSPANTTDAGVRLAWIAPRRSGVRVPLAPLLRSPRTCGGSSFAGSPAIADERAPSTSSSGAPTRSPTRPSMRGSRGCDGSARCRPTQPNVSPGNSRSAPLSPTATGTTSPAATHSVGTSEPESASRPPASENRCPPSPNNDNPERRAPAGAGPADRHQPRPEPITPGTSDARQHSTAGPCDVARFRG